MAFTEKNIVSASKTDFSKYGSGYSNESYSYEMIDGKQHFFAYKDGEKREVGVELRGLLVVVAGAELHDHLRLPRLQGA